MSSSPILKNTHVDSSLIGATKTDRCDRFKLPQLKTVATRNIKQGEVYHKLGWFGHVTLLTLTKEEHIENGGNPNTFRPTFPANESEALHFGTVISKEFTTFGSDQLHGAYLQLLVLLIKNFNLLCQQFLTQEFVSRHKIEGCAPITLEWHKVCIQWLKRNGVSNEDLLFWVGIKGTQNFCDLYGILCANSFFLDFCLSSTIIGLVFCPILARINHDCLPNTFVEKVPSGYRLIAACDIKEGEEITISYVNEPVGIYSNEEMNQVLSNRFGFECECSIHKGKKDLFLKGVPRPISLHVLAKVDKQLAHDLDEINDAFGSKDYHKTRMLINAAEKKYGCRSKFCKKINKNSDQCDEDSPCFIHKHPRFAYFLASKYVHTITQLYSCDDKADKWLRVYQETLLRFCANPVYILRAFFNNILATVIQFTSFERSVETGTKEYHYGGTFDRYSSVFLMSWVNLKNRLQALYKSEETLAFESCMYDGLGKYMKRMKNAFETMEEFMTLEEEESKLKRTNTKGKSGKKKGKKQTEDNSQEIYASSQPIASSRICVVNPYATKDLALKSLNIYFFGKNEPPKAPEVETASPNAILQPDEVDALIQKYNPSYFHKGDKTLNASKEATEKKKVLSEEERALNEEKMRKPNKKQQKKQQHKKKPNIAKTNNTPSIIFTQELKETDVFTTELNDTCVSEPDVCFIPMQLSSEDLDVDMIQ